VGGFFSPKEALGAGGTLSTTEPSHLRRVWLTVELALVYVGAPLAMMSAVHDHRLPVFVALVPVLVVVIVFLLTDPTFSLKRELTRGFGWRTMFWIFGVFVIGGGAVALYVWHYHPSWLFEFPRNRPETYTRIMLLYPAMSVVVQELVYRTFYFHRYGALFGKACWLAIVLNGALFGFGHIVIGTQLAVLSTMATGTLFAIRYALTRSFWAVFVEHTLWGALVFTVGLGHFFFTGVPIIGWRW
jgi:hypothetical protein